MQPMQNEDIVTRGDHSENKNSPGRLSVSILL